jgi:HAE1 family hydrophobic/amphiphilic exporter-1
MSAINAAKARLRPILMTSFAFIFGLLPLIFATGIGAVGNRSIATGAAVGLLVGTFLGLIVIPVLYVIFQWLQEKVKPVQRIEVNLAE